MSRPVELLCGCVLLLWWAAGNSGLVPGLNAIRLGHTQTLVISSDSKLDPHKDTDQISADGADRSI